MVGGRVIETVLARRANGELAVWINCEGTGPEAGEECAIYVEYTDAAYCVEEGDTIWWQGQWVYWTPLTRAFGDYKLKRVGFSGVPRPEPDSIEPSYVEVTHG